MVQFLGWMGRLRWLLVWDWHRVVKHVFSILHKICIEPPVSYTAVYDIL